MTRTRDLTSSSSSSSGGVGGSCTPRPLHAVQLDHPSHTATLLYGLNALRCKGLLLDVTLVAGGQAFTAHRVVLASCSDYFRAMFTDEMRERRQAEIHLNGVTAAGLHCLLEYAYTSRLCLNLANVQDVLAAAAHVQLLTVVEACSTYLQAQLDLDNCVDVATIAETYSLHGLRRRVYAFMSSHLHQLGKTGDFQRLSVAQLQHLLSCDYPVDCSEGQVLLTVAGWLAHCPQDRATHAPALLRALNLQEVPTHTLEHAARLPTLAEPLPPLQRALGVGRGSPAPPTGLVNSRGLELAVVKVGGFSIGGITNEITYYLGSAGRWRHLTTIPHVEQCNYGVSVVGNQLYVVGGCFNQALQENIHPFGFRYNPHHNKWTTMAPMHRERCRFSLTLMGGLLYAVGGATEDVTPATEDESPCEAYSPAQDVWRAVAGVPGARAQHGAASVEGVLYVAGGLEGERVLASCYAYTPAQDAWQPRAPMLTPRADHACVSHGGRLYVCGGWYEEDGGNGRVLADTVECYDPRGDAWSVVTRVPTPRYHAGILVVRGRLYVVGGFHSDATFDRATGVIECYDLEGGRWGVEQPYPQDIWEHVCVPLYVPRCRDDMDVLGEGK
ncbi:Kelch-like protein 10 [Chionoecetes opilio]|uniref:Kelch-like protein diablo n=1 Tax=Chionoecetes opilio TaxID=41210 RepID=A0A8J4XZ72_CHIOP|nr:Kelch-like protein 10 [Chionoecetes opilio]